MGLPAGADKTKVPQTLLLADDSVTIQRVIELTFADEDIDVVAVSDGDQAIARLDSVPPDIVLVDIGMPGKNGYDVAAYVKRSPRLSHIPVVLLTGAFEPVDEARAAGAGCDGVLAKPFEPQLVIGRVKELLSRPVPAPAVGPDSDVAGRPAADAADEGNRSIDDYFDQLDAAFSNLTARPAQPAASAEGPGIDWFGLKHATPSAAPVPEFTDAPGVEAPEPFWTQAARASEAQPEPVAEPVAVAAVEEPARAPVPVPAAVITDDLVAQVSARVLEQLTERVVRETVAEIAERMIREEIERIKQSIQ